MSPTDHKPLPLSTSTTTTSNSNTNYHPSPQRTHSPHIIDQALSRKPILPTGKDAPAPAPAPSTTTTFPRYHFDPSRPSSPTTPLDPATPLAPHDWPSLEDAFAARMAAFRADEAALWEEWRGWGEVFGAWAGTISGHDEERARKRMRTRVAYTRGAEERLEERRVHYVKVVQAFEGALALLGDG